jgi:glycerophosphoryl diester phosphodiesterase
MIKVLGHRGAMKEGCYENTLPGFRQALSAADGLETDAVLASDGTVFLIHETDATTGVLHYEFERHIDASFHDFIAGRRLDQMPRADIERLRTRGGDPIPRLEQLIEEAARHPGCLLNIELKANDTAAPVAALLACAVEKKQIRADQAIVSSFNHPELLKFRRAAPGFRVGMILMHAEAPRLQMYPWLQTSQNAFYEPLARTCLESDLAKAIAPEFLSINVSDMTEAGLSLAETAMPGIVFAVWSYVLYDMPPAEEAAIYDRLEALNRGRIRVFAFITGHPQAAAAELARRGLRTAAPAPTKAQA